ncbi:hypothetical protein Acr_28g0014830 [Actinidia rufa]|uniref:Uncharacterized protein n=1 Tax=Actinidia rufa TaxID=165716 RepID=A0A7J0HCI8_9ERIC|nr:hypothetical protein Acr_28g0014830 [Actinidia rufa]
MQYFAVGQQITILGELNGDNSATFHAGRVTRKIFFRLGRQLGVPSDDSSRGRDVRVPRSWSALGAGLILYRGGEVPSGLREDRRGHFKIPVILNSKTFLQVFRPRPSRGILKRRRYDWRRGRGEAEGDIRGESAATADHARIIREEMLSPHAFNLDVKAVRGKGPRPLRPDITVSATAMSRRLKISELAKVVTQKVAPLSEAKKNKTGSGVHEAPTRPPTVPGEGSSARRTLGEALGPQVSVMASATTAEKILARVILPVDKEKGVILGSSLAVCSRDFVEGALNQRALAESSEMEMVRAQNRAIELEGALAEEKTKGKKATEKIETRNEVVAKLEARVTELEKSQNLAKGRIIAAFKESDDFLEVVRGSTSSYFGDGFDFCKRQLAHQYPNLGLDLEDIEMDHDLLAQEEIEAEKRATEDGGATEEERTGEIAA